MLLTTLVVGGLLFGRFRYRRPYDGLSNSSVKDVVNSTKAVFAADSGVEWELYRMFKDSDYPKPIMTNQTDFSTTVSGSNIVKSVGSSNRSSRAFEITIQ